MKKITIVYFSMILFLPFIGSAQVTMQVNAEGQVVAGPLSMTFQPSPSGTLTSLRVLPLTHPQFGGAWGASKIDFGYWPGVVSIGEYVTSGSYRMSLYGDGGIYFRSKYNSSVKNFMVYDPTSWTPYGDILHINAETTSLKYGTCIEMVETSDARFKKDIAELSNPLLQLIKLHGVSYMQDLSGHSKYKSQNGFVSEYSDQEEKPEPVKIEETKRIGFLAQELQEVFPELVKSDNDGNLYINYTGLIPVIVEALKEQQAIITAQSAKIAEMSAEMSADKAGKTQPQLKGIEVKNAFLYQNAPNPFSHTTTILYFIDGGFQNASIYIFDMQGKLLNSYPILATAGEGSVEISAAGLAPGMYLYSLIVNNQEIDTKRMVITE